MELLVSYLVDFSCQFIQQSDGFSYSDPEVHVIALQTCLQPRQVTGKKERERNEEAGRERETESQGENEKNKQADRQKKPEGKRKRQGGREKERDPKRKRQGGRDETNKIKT